MNLDVDHSFYNDCGKSSAKEGEESKRPPSTDTALVVPGRRNILALQPRQLGWTPTNLHKCIHRLRFRVERSL